MFAVQNEELRKENDEKKKYLWGYQKARRQLVRLEEELLELRLDKAYPSINQDGMPRGCGGSDLSGYAARVDELERKIIRARYKRIQKFKEIRDRIERLEDENEKDVLVYRYIKGMKWEEIAMRMNFSWKHIHRFHSNALTHFKMT